MKLMLRNVRQETSDTWSFRFDPDRALNWRAGQFLKYTLPHPDADDRGEERYFTIAAAPYEKVTMITTRFAKNGSSFKRALRAMRPGDTIEADELDGDFVVDEPERDHIFVAGGIGVTPFRSILLDLNYREKPVNVTLLYANRNEEFPYKAELEGLRGKHRRLQIEYFVHPRRIDEKVMEEFRQRLRDPFIYVSGPEPMVEAFGSMLQGMGVPESRIKSDFFPGYEWPGEKRSMASAAANGKASGE